VNNKIGIPGLDPGIHVLAVPTAKEDVDGRVKRAFTPAFDGLCPAMTDDGFARRTRNTCLRP
jgi:hypothetical protein